MNVDKILKITLTIILLGLFLPMTIPVKTLIFKNGKLIEVIWTDGTKSILKKGKWILK